MYRQNQSLVELLSPVVRAMGYEVLGLEHGGNRGTPLLQLYIDSEQGIGLEDCSRVNSQVGALLDMRGPLGRNYRLEVSSPGLDRPLFTLEQFSRFVGQRARVKMRDRKDGRQTFTGRIEAVIDNAVRITTVDGEFTLLGDDIRWARLVPEYR